MVASRPVNRWAVGLFPAAHAIWRLMFTRESFAASFSIGLVEFAWNFRHYAGAGTTFQYSCDIF
jgi:hypothetical protein